MFIRCILLALACAPTLALASKRGHLAHRSHANIPFRQVPRQADNTACVSPDPANTVTDRLNLALNSSGPNFVLHLCPNAHYLIQTPIFFFATNQEISTVGYPTDNSRATLVVGGPVANGQGHTTAVDGTCANCSGAKLRNIQVDGARAGGSPTGGGANIEMGGPNANQLIEYVHSYDPRSWSCLHVAEGGLLCNNVVVQNNDIGPCGSDAYQQWADGISISCRSATVRNNTVRDPTDGGIVLFGSPGTLVENNTIWVVNKTLLGGINMVDVTPWGGNYSGTVVRNNTIFGGFATDSKSASQKDGENVDDVIVKIGIAIGPQTWFNDQFGANVSSSGTVLNNQLTGAFGYGIAITSADNFTVQGNVLIGNTSFIGSRGPNCSASDPTPQSAPFIVEYVNVTTTALQSDFQPVQDAKGLTCVKPPDGGNYWPYGGNPSSGNTTSPVSSSSSPGSTPTSSSAQGSGGRSRTAAKVALAIGIVVVVVGVVVAVILIRKWAINRELRDSIARDKAYAGFVED